MPQADIRFLTLISVRTSAQGTLATHTSSPEVHWENANADHFMAAGRTARPRNRSVVAARYLVEADHQQFDQHNNEGDMGRGILLWRLGVPIPIVLIILLFG
jgi:hypothetical protein